ncbi:Transcription elongation factor SPT4 [Diplonema papillatum]|nr:Transcription elongation factor SPT4 [Diplonema papillatum]
MPPSVGSARASSAGSSRNARLSQGFSVEFEQQARDVFQYVPRIAEARGDSLKDARKIDNRKLRACLRCKMLKTLDQYVEQGCNNCAPYTDPTNERANPVDCVLKNTTTNFEGMVCICTGSRQDSWVCRWQDLCHASLAPGAYAVTLRTEVEDEVEDDQDSYDNTEAGSEAAASEAPANEGSDEDMPSSEVAESFVGASQVAATVKSEFKAEVKSEIGGSTFVSGAPTF